MTTDVEQQSQTTEFIRDNIVKIVDKNGEFYGSGFFIEINQQVCCITCHHCIYTIDEIFVERFGNRFQTKWTEEYSDMKKDLAVLKVENCTLKPLIYAKEAMANFAVTIRGFSGERIKDFPEGTSGRESSLSDSTTSFEVREDEYKGSNKWNTKPAVYVNVYECEGKFDLGFSGSPVYYKGPNKVVGIFTAKEENFGYVIPIQTLLDKFGNDKSNAKQSTKISQPQPTSDTQSMLEEGNQLLDKKMYNEAIQKYDKIIYDSNYYVAIFNKAYTLGEMGRHEEAAEWYDKALAIDPNDGIALTNKGWNLNNLGKFKEAIEWYDKALAIDPNYVMALNNKAFALHKLGMYPEAIEWYDKALAIDPNYTYALNNRGLALNNLGKYKEAIVWYDKALAIDPNYVMALNNRGLALDNLGKFKEAIVWYDKALAIDPNYVMALNNKGSALDNLGKYKEAIEWYDKALAIDPNYVTALNNTGWALNNLGKYKEAIVWYDKALAIDPNYTYALNNKKHALEKIGRKSVKKNR